MQIYYLVDEKLTTGQANEYVFVDDEFNYMKRLTANMYERVTITSSTTIKGRKETSPGKFNGAWEVLESSSSDQSYSSKFYINYIRPENACTDDWLPVEFTQTLFNTDDKYEYLVPILPSDSRDTESIDRDGDGQVDYIVTISGACVSGFKIMNETGNTIQTENFPSDFRLSTYDNDVDIWRIGDKYYLLFSDADNAIIYRINRSSSGTPVTKLRAIGGMAVSPRMARRSTPVTVTLDKDMHYSMLQLIDEAGRVAMAEPVEGRPSVQLETSSLKSGMYIVRAIGDLGSQETCKIIIR